MRAAACSQRAAARREGNERRRRTGSAPEVSACAAPVCRRPPGDSTAPRAHVGGRGEAGAGVEGAGADGAERKRAWRCPRCCWRTGDGLREVRRAGSAQAKSGMGLSGAHVCRRLPAPAGPPLPFRAAQQCPPPTHAPPASPLRPHSRPKQQCTLGRLPPPAAPAPAAPAAPRASAPIAGAACRQRHARRCGPRRRRRLPLSRPARRRRRRLRSCCRAPPRRRGPAAPFRRGGAGRTPRRRPPAAAAAAGAVRAAPARRPLPHRACPAAPPP